MSRLLRAVLASLFLALVVCGPARAADAVGDWLGTLTVQPGFDLRIAIHVSRSPAGVYRGTWDSLDQGLFDDPLSNVSVAGDALSFDVPRLNAAYLGKWDAASGRWVGMWAQAGHSLPLAFAKGLAPPAPTIAGLDGEWDGTLDMGVGLCLRLALHIITGPHGTLGTYDSIDQGGYGAPLSSVERDGGHVRIVSKLSGFVIDGALVDGGQTLAARFTQGGGTLPLLLRHLPPGAASPWPAQTPQTSAVAPAHWTPPSDAEIRALLAQRIDVEHQGVGIVIGVIDPSGRRIIAYGKGDQPDGRPLDGNSEFEIGSITKVFTALVLADMVSDGEVKLDDPAQKYLPAGVTMPTRDGKQITLVDLATHTSGLPRLPTNFAPKDPANPYADYTAEQLYQFLSSYRLTRDPGASWAYSNLGFGLLGHLLSLRAGQPYESLVKARVIGPLGLKSTTVTLSADEAGRMTVGHDSSMRPVPLWNMSVLAGAGALRSTANDMLTFLAANLGLTDTPLKDDMAVLLSVRRPMQTGAEQALGWEIARTPAGEIIEHGGGTGGYHTLVAFNPKTQTGVVVMTNAETVNGADDIGMHVLIGSPVLRLAPPPPPAPPAVDTHHAITLPPEALERFVGRYRVTPSIELVITRDGDHLYGQVTGQPVREIVPESPTLFFAKGAGAEVTFTTAADGRVTGLVVHQSGRDLPATREP